VITVPGTMNVTDRQILDGQTAYYGITVLCVSSLGKNVNW